MSIIGPGGLSGIIPDFRPPKLPDSGDIAPAIRDLLIRGMPPAQQGGILRTLERLASAGANAIGDLSDWAGKVKDSLTSLPNSAANALADSMRGPAARELTSGETAALRGAFGNSIDLTNVRIVNGPGHNPDAAIAFNVGGNPAITEGNTVYIRSDGYKSDLSVTSEGVNTLVHEFTHVRQYQQLGFGSFYRQYAGDLIEIGDRDQVYKYATRTRDFRSETLEGQAEMVGDYAGYRAGEGKLNAEKAAVIEVKLRGTGIFGL